MLLSNMLMVLVNNVLQRPALVCGQVALGDIRYGRLQLGQELAVCYVEPRKIDNLWSSPDGYPFHSPYMTCCLTGSLDTVSTDIEYGHTSFLIYCSKIKTYEIIWLNIKLTV